MSWLSLEAIYFKREGNVWRVSQNWTVECMTQSINKKETKPLHIMISLD